MLRTLKNNFAFLRQFRQRFETTGAIAPSSRFLAKAMTRFLATRGDGPVRVLEIGPGTGPVTEKIVPLLRTGDRFDLVELNESFVEILNERFQEFQSDEKYDFVISGLPLNNFPADLVEAISNHYFEVLKPTGMLSYFEYMYVRPIRKVVTRGDENTRITRIDDIMAAHCAKHRVARDNILINIPPAWVQHLSGSPGQGDGVDA
jgi:phosphatidylethanolamine/phosphatidyl-N-methylethanolamine N-methyltransferase